MTALMMSCDYLIHAENLAKVQMSIMDARAIAISLREIAEEDGDRRLLRMSELLEASIESMLDISFEPISEVY